MALKENYFITAKLFCLIFNIWCSIFLKAFVKKRFYQKPLEELSCKMLALSFVTCFSE